MPIAGDHPETGVRILIERDKLREDPPFLYKGSAFLPAALAFPLEVTVDAEGTALVTLSPNEQGQSPPADLAEKVRLIVRTVYRQAKADNEPPAWRILRWRGEK